MKRDKYDTVVSDLVREMHDWTCESCGKQFHNNRSALHCSHFHGRVRKSTRYDLDNCQAHCDTCHKLYTDHPNLHTAHYEKVRGSGMLAITTERARMTKKWEPPSKKTGYKGEKEAMYQHYKSELKRLKALREDGIMGYIEVTNWGI